MKPQHSSEVPSLSDAPRVLKQCPLCSHEYNKKEVTVVDEEKGAQLVHMTCGKCHQAMLAFVVVSQLGLSSVGMLTDLTILDVMNIKDKEPFDEDDILEFHKAVHDPHFIHNLTGKPV